MDDSPPRSAYRTSMAWYRARRTPSAPASVRCLHEPDHRHQGRQAGDRGGTRAGPHHHGVLRHDQRHRYDMNAQEAADMPRFHSSGSRPDQSGELRAVADTRKILEARATSSVRRNRPHLAVIIIGAAVADGQAGRHNRFTGNDPRRNTGCCRYRSIPSRSAVVAVRLRSRCERSERR